MAGNGYRVNATTVIVLGLVASTFGCGAPQGADAPQLIALPGDAFYPESLNASRDGRLYVGSLATGSIVSVEPSGSGVETVVAPSGVGTTGVLVDDEGESLWACAVDQSTQPPTTEVRQYGLGTGELLARFAFSAPAFCNDLERASGGELYVSDSYGAIWRLAPRGASLEVWSRDPLLAPSRPDGFGANGLALDGEGHLYVGTNADGRLLRISIEPDGRAGEVAEIAVTPALELPDGLRLVDAGTLLVAEGAGNLVRVEVDGLAATRTIVATGLNGPTSVVVVGDDAWVTEGQLGHLLGYLEGGPVLPFDVRRVALR